MARFPCRQSFLIWLITTSVTGIFLYLSAKLKFYLEQNFEFPQFVYFIGFILLSSVIVTLFLFFVPIKVDVKDHLIQLHFTLRKVIIPTSEVQQIGRIHKIPVVDIGSRGYFGWLGYSNGGARVFVQDRKQMVYIKTKTKEYVISCSNPERLVLEVERRI